MKARMERQQTKIEKKKDIEKDRKEDRRGLEKRRFYEHNQKSNG